VNRMLKAIVVFLAAVYFLVDAIFLTFARSLANWIAEHWIFESFRAWIISLTPYPALALFALPLAVLEPVKPNAAYLVGTGHVVTGLTLMVAGEILKLMLVERLFSISRDKLMSIPAFAWVYRNSIISTIAWQGVRRWSPIAQYLIRSHALKAARNPRRIIFQSR